jgi:hypothetical protein
VIVTEFRGLPLNDALVIVIYYQKQEEITGAQKRRVRRAEESQLGI